MRPIKYLIFLLIIFFVGCSNEQLQIVETEIDRLIDENAEIASISVGIVFQNKELEFHSGELLDRSQPNSKSLYEIASLTKTFTGLLLAKAISEKKISLDEDIRNYLSGELENLEFDGQPITVRDLLTHRSGLPLFFPYQEDLFKNEINWDVFPFEWNWLQKGYSRNDFFESLSNYEITKRPGSNVYYSNVGANLIGYLLESIYQKSYAVLLNENILQPLKMNETSIGLVGRDTTHLVVGLNANKVIMPARVQKAMSAEGGLIANTEDMLRYMKFHLNSKKEYVSIAHSALVEGNENDYHRGMFWQLNDNKSIYQLGGAFGTSSLLKLDIAAGIGIFIVTNSAGVEVHPKLEKCIDNMLNTLKAMN